FVHYSDACHRYLSSFPTRRSSDLVPMVLLLATAASTIASAAPCGFAITGLRSSRLDAICRRGGSDRAPRPPASLHARSSETPIPDRKSTRLNSSHVAISYAVFCLK